MTEQFARKIAFKVHAIDSLFGYATKCWWPYKEIILYWRLLVCWRKKWPNSPICTFLLNVYLNLAFTVSLHNFSHLMYTILKENSSEDVLWCSLGCLEPAGAIVVNCTVIGFDKRACKFAHFSKFVYQATRCVSYDLLCCKCILMIYVCLYQTLYVLLLESSVHNTCYCFSSMWFMR